jgi:transcriptional regulator with XRE-family HTH domain
MKMPDVKKPHIGRKIEKLRELRGMKQETLAAALGVTQQTISRMENSEEVDDEKLAKVAEALGVSTDTIKTFNEESVINYIQNNTFNDTATNTSQNSYNYGTQDEALTMLINAYRELAETQKEHNRLLQQIIEKMKG